MYIVTIRLTYYGIWEFNTNDDIFNIPITQEIGKLKEYPSVVGKLIPLGSYLIKNFLYIMVQ